MNEKNYTRSIFHVLVFFAIISVAAILKLTQSVIVPVTIAVLLSFVFYPFVQQMNSLSLLFLYLLLAIICSCIYIIYHILYDFICVCTYIFS